MTHFLREVLPRVELRKRDQVPGQYPTVARTGDRRLGKNTGSFDDTTTIVYVTTGTLVNYPTTLYAGSPLLTQFNSSSITVTNGSVTKTGISGQMTSSWQVENYSSFFEDQTLYEQNMDHTSSFYVSGTYSSDVGLGFSSKLGSKTAIRIKIPIISEAVMSAKTASIFYLNSAVGRFEEVGLASKQAPAGLETGFSEVRLFGPFGDNTLKGTSAFGSLIQFQAISSSLAAGLLYQETSASQLLDGNFAPTGSQLIKMSDYISQPFLIEKAVIEVPFKAGPGWLQDNTRFKSVSINSSLGATFDSGGPCITFALLNNLPDRRDLILSATCIPAGDNKTSFELTVITDVSITQKSLVGFTGYSHPPSCIIQSSSNNTFTGSAVMIAAPVISNGVIASGPNGVNTLNLTQSGNDAFPNATIVGVNTFNRSQYTTQPSGRSLFGKEYAMPSNISTLTSNVQKAFGIPTPPTYNLPNIFFYQQNKVSPYLVFPTDNITLAASKYRAVQSNLYSSFAQISTGAVTLAQSHDAVLTSGSLFLTLYGSLISNASEFHDTLNQRLETCEIHEMIGANHVIDQFAVEYLNTFSGSTEADQLTGSILSSSNSVFTPGSRVIWADATNFSIYSSSLYVEIDEIDSNATFDSSVANFSDLATLKKEKFSLKRFSQAFSQNERFFDSCVPGIDDVFKADGTNIYGLQFAGTGDCVTFTLYGFPTIFVTFDTNVNDTAPASIFGSTQTSNIDWTKSFPFEPKYSDILRQQSSDIFYDKSYFQACTIIEASSFDKTKAQKVLVTHTPVYTGGGESPNLFSTHNGMRTDTYLKLIYGFGDLNTYLATETIATISAACASPALTANLNMGCTQAPNYRARQDFTNVSVGSCPYTHVYRGAVIRGWKYGLINGQAQYSQAVWRFNRYGQPRDMLEQRLDTKFYEALGFNQQGVFDGNIGELPAPVAVRFYNSEGDIVPANSTFSSNLHYTATSSLPYFDGVVRNREEPLNLPGLGNTIITG